MNKSRRKARERRVKQITARRLRTELLESRQLLAADNPFHNVERPSDINGDGNINVTDLRASFQDIAANGVRELAMTGPFAEGEAGGNNYLDVNADGYVSPADLRLVYNSVLSGEGEANMQLEVFMDVVDENGSPVTVATVGQTLTLDVDIRDARVADADNPDGSPMWPGLNDSSSQQGVFAAYFDFAHSTNLENASAPDEFGCNFDIFTQQTTATCQYDHGDYNSINETGSFPTVEEDVDNNVPGQPDKVDIINELGGTAFQAFMTNRANLVEIHFTVNGTDLTAVDDTAQTDEGTPVNIDVLSNDSVVSELFFDRRVPVGNQTEISFLRGGTPGNPAEEHLSVVDESEIFGDKVVTVPISGVAIGGLQIVSTTSGNAIVDDNDTPTNTADDFITFTPAAQSPGMVDIVYSISDGAGTTVTATVEVEVGTNNDPPEHTTPTLNGNEETAIQLTGVSVSDSDAGAATNIETIVTAQNGTLNATINGQQQSGASLTITGDLNTINAALQTMTFTGDVDFFGTEVLTIETDDMGNTGDGGPMQTTDNITINVANVNDPPVLTNPGDQNVADDDVLPLGLDVTDVDSANIEVDISLTSTTGASGEIGAINVNNTTGVTVTGNGGENVTISGPLASVRNALQSVDYTPDDFSGFLGVVTIDVDADDQDGGLDSESFDIEVEPGVLPRARRDTLIVDEDSTGSNTVNVVDVLANDLTTNSQSTAFLVSFQQSANGTVALVQGQNGDGTDDQVTFTPTGNFAGTTTFTYVMDETPSQGGVESTGTVNVTVREENDAPTAADTTATFMEDQVLSAADFQNLLDSLPVTPGGGADEASQQLTIISMTLLNQNGGATVSNTGITFDTDYNNNIGGPLEIEYVVQDNGTTAGAADPLTATATLTVNVTAKNDNPIANTESLSLDKNGATLTEDIDTSISIATLLANDTAGPTTATDELQTQTVTFNGLVSTTTSAGGTITVNGTDLDYEPPTDFNGTDTFSYTVTDGDLTSDPAVVTLTIAAVNDAPIPGDDFTDEAVKGVPLTISISDLLSNDDPGPATATDEANQLLSITAVQDGPNNSVEIVGSTVVFTPDPGFSGSTFFNYTLSDGIDTATGRVDVEVADFIPSTFSGYLVVDTNTNGVKDAGEQTLAGVEITISGTDLNDDVITPITITTNHEGHYSFDNLTPGTYNITKTHPSFFIDGVEQLGNGGTTSPSNDTFSITIGPAGGIDSEDNNFGVYGLDPNFFSIEELRAKFPADGALIGLDGSGDQQWVSSRGAWGNMSANATVATSISTDMRMVTITVTDGSTVHTETFDSHTDSRVRVMGDDGNGGAVIRIDGDISDLFSQIEAEGEAHLEESIDMLAAANRVAHVDKVFEQLG